MMETSIFSENNTKSGSYNNQGQGKHKKTSSAVLLLLPEVIDI